MANSFIGKAISLLSHSDVRYRGILAGLDPSNSTIQLQNVYSMGTENRRPSDEYIPPADLPYQFIIFRASEVKDIALDNEPLPTRVRSVHDDPAVIGASGPPISNGTYGQYPVPAQNGVTPPPPQQVPATLGQRPPVGGVPQPVAGQGAQVQPGQPGEQQQPKQAQSQPNTTTASGRTSSNSRRANNGSVANATASIEKVERAISEVRLSNTNARSKKHGGGQHQQRSELTVPKTDFDFQSSNARFDKTALASQAGTTAAIGAGGQARIDDESDTNTNPSEDDGDKAVAAANKSPKDKEPSYNPRKSFFDNLSSSASTAPPSGGGGGRGRGRGGGLKSRREEEREKNVATFGEPGGVGLMGPGAYVGGYGHGRRGGRAGRRGGGVRRNPSGAHQHQQ